MPSTFPLLDTLLEDALPRVAGSALPDAPVRPHVGRWRRATRALRSLITR